MILVGGSSHVRLARSVAKYLGCECVIAHTQKFADQELNVHVDYDFYGKEVLILQSTCTPANDYLVELLLLADIAKRMGSQSITAVIPYFGYARQDRVSHTYGALSAGLIARLIQHSGVDRVVTIDLHSRQSEGFFDIALKNLDPTLLFLSQRGLGKESVVVSPDIGGVFRGKAFASRVGIDFAMIHKNRTYSGECTASELMGDVAHKHCIIVDDIVDTGSTLCSGVTLLKKQGAKSVGVCVTHGVFSKGSLDKIAQLDLEYFYVTDTIPHDIIPSFITVVSTSRMIVDALRKHGTE